MYSWSAPPYSSVFDVQSSHGVQTSLVSVDGLSRLVDPSQLTSDLSGSLEYDHVEWTELRLGLEEFSGAATQLLAQLEQLEAGLSRLPEAQDVDEARK